MTTSTGLISFTRDELVDLSVHLSGQILHLEIEAVRQLYACPHWKLGNHLGCDIDHRPDELMPLQSIRRKIEYALTTGTAPPS